MKNYKIIYVCVNCKAEISQGAIECSECDRKDPKIEVAGLFIYE